METSKSPNGDVNINNGLERTSDWTFAVNNDLVITHCTKSKESNNTIDPQNLMGLEFRQFLPDNAEDDVLDFLNPKNLLDDRTIATAYNDVMTGTHILRAAPIFNDNEFEGYWIIVNRINDEIVETLRKEIYGEEITDSDKKLATQLKQQELIAKLSLEFAKNDDVEYLFNYAIMTLGEFLKVDRCSVFLHNHEEKHYSVIYEWCAPGIPSTKEILNKIPYNEEDEGFIQLTTRPYIAVDDTFQYSGEAYKVQRESGVHSFVDLPLIVEGKFWGFLGADYGSGPHYWTQSEFHMLQTIGGIMASTLEKRIMEDKIRTAMETANEANQAKTDFLSRMSHEIRTPMNAIIGMNEIAKISDDQDKVKYCLSRIERASHQLLGIINDILDLSKIEADKMEIQNEPFDFEKMLQSTFSVVQPNLDEKNLNFRFDLNKALKYMVVSDEMRLTQVINNLLSNAIKFTPEGGSICLKARFDHINSNNYTLTVEVKDSGIGVSPEEQKKLFKSFEQADGSITRRFGGTGLGLSICKKIMDLMGGEIWVESNEGEGSTFSFRVPVKSGDEIEHEHPKMYLKKDVNILVIDDDSDALEYAKNLIESFKMNCDVAKDGYEGIEIIKNAKEEGHYYDIVLIDWQMPGLDGVETGKRIIEFVDSNTIVIMVSVADWSEFKGRAEEYGISYFLAKPLLPSPLFNLIARLLSRSVDNGQEQAAHIEIKDRNWENKKILAVEDVDINQEILATILEPTGVQIDQAYNGKEAYNAFSTSGENYDIILMDVQMPEMDGYEATKEIRKSSTSDAETVPIIAMTANAFKEDVEKCLEAGMNGHIAKPIDMQELFAKLDKYLS